MQSNALKVKYVTVKNCFIYLPDTWDRQSTTKDNVIRVKHKDREFYFSWNSQPGSQDNYLRISATFARALGIDENDDVVLSFDDYPRSVARVVVVPRNSQDWEIVELQSNKIQESLLNQINIVASNQQIVVWISKFLSVVLTVESIEPVYKYGRLEPFTEVEVSLPKTKKLQDKSKVETASKSGVWDTFKNLVPRMLSSDSNETKSEIFQESVENMLRKSSENNLPEIYRVLPLKNFDKIDSMSSRDSLLTQPYNIFIRQYFLPRNIRNFKEIYCRIRKVEQNIQFINKIVTNTNFLRNDNAGGSIPTKEIIARIFVIEEFLRTCSNNIDREYFLDYSNHKSIYLSDNLRENLKLKVGAKITLELIAYSAQAVESIEIFPQNESMTEQKLMDYFEQRSKYNKILINSFAKLTLSKEVSCFVKISPPESSYALIDFYDLKSVSINIREVSSSLPNQSETSEDAEKRVSLDNISIRCLEPVLSECESVLRLSLSLDKNLGFNYDRENILICGKIGSGKTTVCKILNQLFHGAPNFVYFNEVDCKALKGKKVEILHKTFLPIILDCVYHQPAILLIDDIESIAGRTSDEEENTPDSINAARIADMLLNMITEYQAVHYIAVVATCTSVGKISQKLAAPRGIHLFRTILSVSDFEKEDRMDILRLSLKSRLHVSNDIDWNDYGNKTEGWMPQDLVNFAKKSVFTAWKRHVKSGSKAALTLSDEDLSQSLENSTPMSLQGVDLYSGPGHAWSDIGGLSEAKQSLIELLHWPLKYPELFKNAPIKHQGGVLLYGVPGTGKTMLAGAIAKECGLSFISVKGPELLSKYIGASEEAVRNVFEKANSAKPCVLFFDEFDSLAPRRGHDSTGVTDRVVNQFLAQLDGVEGRQGVAVVAASSRPDLLDPALLRPGRLDKALLCPLPNETEREEILSALCRSQNIETTSLDLKKIANETPGFTGADLNAIISQGRLSALEESLAERKAVTETNDNVSGSVSTTIVSTLTQKHLTDALGSTRPSLTSSEKLKYDRIYAKFSRSGELSNENVDKSNNTYYQRATLA